MGDSLVSDALDKQHSPGGFWLGDAHEVVLDTRSDVPFLMSRAVLSERHTKRVKATRTPKKPLGAAYEAVSRCGCAVKTMFLAATMVVTRAPAAALAETKFFVTSTFAEVTFFELGSGASSRDKRCSAFW